MTAPHPKQAQWAELDWNLTNRELARQTGYCENHLWKMRNRHAPQTRRIPVHRRVAEGADWQMSNGELAAQYGASYSTVSIMRQRCAPHTKSRRLAWRHEMAVNRARWQAFNWQQSDAGLARQHGLSRERVRQIRQLISAPKSIFQKTSNCACEKQKSA